MCGFRRLRTQPGAEDPYVADLLGSGIQLWVQGSRFVVAYYWPAGAAQRFWAQPGAAPQGAQL